MDCYHQENKRHIAGGGTRISRLGLIISRAWLLLLSAMYGCQPERDIPDIYIDQTSEILVNGENAIKKQYFEALEICSSLGKEVRGLSEKDVEKLGLRRHRFIITRNRVASRTESWGYRMTGHYHNPGECRFTLTYSGDLTVKMPGRTVVYDLAEGVIKEEEEGLPEAFGLPFLPLSETPDAEEIRERDTTGIRKSGEEVLGQPALRWTYPDGKTEVIWSGGRQWGFSELPSGQAYAMPGNMILERKQQKEQYTTVLKTHRFTVGSSIDPEPFTLPEALENRQ